MIANINSLAGRNPAPLETLYCAGKYGLRGFSESLQIESIGTDIKIMDFYPGSMQTDMCKNKNEFESLINPLEAAQTICHLMLEKRSTVLPTEIILRKFKSQKEE
jgi:short-subunit dehydrogenase